MAKKNITIILLLIYALTIAQEKQEKRAEADFNNYAFMDAISSYEDLVKAGKSDEEIFKKLGNANYINAWYDVAAEWYIKLFELKNDNIEAEYIYRYAQCLKSLEKYDESVIWMDKFNQAKSNDSRAKNFVDNRDYIQLIEKNSNRYTIANQSINSNTSDFAPSFYRQKIVFSTARDVGLTSKSIHKWNNSAFLNLYSAQVTEDEDLETPEKFSQSLNTKTHESSTVFTKDGNTVYFTRNNSRKGKFSRDKDGISRLKLYKSDYKDGEWQKPKELPFNNDNYSVAHPALSEDEKILYFSSDMEGSIGSSDIFKVNINSDGTYGIPENLGTTINTEGRETFPFIFGQILYFASDGHPGLGGLDVFAIKLDNQGNKVLNVGRPINGSQDDFSYIVNKDGKGYFASNRKGGIGSDDIYSFVEKTPLEFKCLSDLSGKVVSARTGEVIAEATVAILDKNGVIIFDAISNAEGEFSASLNCSDKEHRIVVNKEGYESESEVVEFKFGDSNEVELKMSKTIIKSFVKKGADLLNYLNLEAVLFDFDKAVIRKDAKSILQSVADYMNKNEELKVEIRSHTDAKASKAYNKKLSIKRAKATKNRLVKLGVSPERLVCYGFGEENLTNDCVVWEKCSSAENEQNRRSEIIVIQ